MEERGDYFIVATTSNRYIIDIGYYRYEPYYDTEKGWGISIQICNQTGCNTVYIPSTMHVDVYPGMYDWLYIYTSRIGDSENNLYVINVSNNLSIVGELRGLAKGERIYSSRLFGDIFYLVTYRTVDPLFAINISNPAQPEIIGYVKIPGFSEYLHPLSRDMLLGIGMDGSDLKISLFNISDPRNITEISLIKVNEAYSNALYDHRAVTFDAERHRFYLPFNTWYKGGGVLVISYANNNLSLIKVLDIGYGYVSRTAYIGEKLYTISSDVIRVYNIETLELLKEIQL